MPRRNTNASAVPRPTGPGPRACLGCRACGGGPSTSQGPLAGTLAQKVNEAGKHPDLARRHSSGRAQRVQATG
jgi:hypothetical protein